MTRSEELACQEYESSHLLRKLYDSWEDYHQSRDGVLEAIENDTKPKRTRVQPDRYGYDEAADPYIGQIVVGGHTVPALFPGKAVLIQTDIKYQKSRKADFDLLDDWLLNTSPLRRERDRDNEVWHHFQNYNYQLNSGTMQLVNRLYHDGKGNFHWGGVSQWQVANGANYG
jgi:hypothetical protein